MTPHEPQPLVDPVAARLLSDEQWVELHVPRYAAVATAYEEYALFLKEVLGRMVARLAPLAIVEARAKSMPGFAEKILRKRPRYQTSGDKLPPDPLVRMTDLCGGRVICQTAAHVAEVCRWIESAFVIDWANSEDVGRRLKPAEFGYRSVHYIVQIHPDRLEAAGIRVVPPPALLGIPPGRVDGRVGGIPLKAEIQVRTLLEHASSTLGHDAIYKTELKVPHRIQRQYAAIAAVLEGADHEVGDLLEKLDRFRSNTGTWMDPARMEHEIAHARVLLGLDETHLSAPVKVPIAVRAAKLALALGEHDQALDILLPFRDRVDGGIFRALGHVLVDRHWNEPLDPAFTEGVEFLRQAVERSQADAGSLCLLAECEARRYDDEKARELFARAVAMDGTEPLTLVRYLEFEAARQKSDTLLSVASPMIRAAMTRARGQIEACSNLPEAWSSLALLHLFRQEPFGALHALAQVIRLAHRMDDAHPAGAKRHCAAGRALMRLRESARRLEGLRDSLAGFRWFERLLTIAMVHVSADPPAGGILELASWRIPGARNRHPHFHPDRKAVFLAGGCHPSIEPFMEPLADLLGRACQDLEFDLISGGTPAGISGVGGGIATRSGGRIRPFGYLPAALPRGEKEDSAGYPDRFNSPETDDFSPLDPLQAWTDLLAAGVAPASVKVLCYAPGEIARAECAIALALGATVGVLVDPALPRDRQFDQAPWDGCLTLMRLPMDAMTLRAFLQIDHRPLDESDRVRLEPAARLAHEDYLRSAPPGDPSLQPWDKLADHLKRSNYHQVAYWERTLAGFGLALRPLTEADRLHPPPQIEDLLPKQAGRDLLLELAEVEHGRWNAERLGFGWQHAPEKDVLRKLSPWIVPWDHLPQEIKQYDIDAIVGLPAKLRLAEMEIYQPAPPPAGGTPA